ncbi:MAG: YifB family Mg chelatase-like AAA ATPase [Pseudomonadota bacterium]
MVAEIATFAFHGIDARIVTVQVQITGGANAFTIVGLPDKAVSEARERVRAALAAVGLGLPAKRVTVSLAPADLPKMGGHFDLPIALGLMAEMGACPRDAIDGFAAMGELRLDGSIADVTGVLPGAVAANAEGLGLICPQGNGPEAAWANGDTEILAPKSLIQIVNHFKGAQLLTRPEPGALESGAKAPDLRDVRGQHQARRALEVAAAGGHNLLMVGPPGSGKSMLAARLPGILPPMSPAETLDVSMVHSMAGFVEKGRLTRARPFRTPHHSASMAAMVGGGAFVRPGEAALAHRGVLFLDELPEFSAPVLDSLRQPLETGDVMIARANARIRFPARFQLVAAMNPCRCGYGAASGRACKRGRACEAAYQARISGPLLDRLDLAITLAPVPATDLLTPANGEPSAQVARRVEAARAAQRERSADLGPTATAETLNAFLTDEALARVATPDAAGTAILAQAVETFGLSARAYFRILRVARTLADLEGATALKRRHVAEAIAYRQRSALSEKPASEKTVHEPTVNHAA